MEKNEENFKGGRKEEKTRLDLDLEHSKEGRIIITRVARYSQF